VIKTKAGKKATMAKTASKAMQARTSRRMKTMMVGQPKKHNKCKTSHENETRTSHRNDDRTS